MGAGASSASCTKYVDVVTDEEVKLAVKAISDWEDSQKAAARATQALKTVRKDSFKKAANELNSTLVERIGGADRIHDVIQAFYRKLFGDPEVAPFFERLSADRMRSKQMKFMRYLFGGPSSYSGNLRCIHARMVTEQGLDLPKFNKVVGMLLETFKELRVPQDVVDDVVINVEAARSAIFTPNPDELVSKEELIEAAAALKAPLITRMGGPEAIQAIVAIFYKKLFTNESLKYFFINMTTERLRNMQFKFMRYLFAGAASYATTGGNMRCVHARLVQDNGLDLPKFNMVCDMLKEAMHEQMVSKANVREVLANVEAAKAAIFTPGPDECVTREEMVEAARALNSSLVERMGGPEAVYEVIRVFYSRLFNDNELKYFFTLSADRLRTKQFRFMTYLFGGPEQYEAAGGNLRCKHAALVKEKGLDLAKFNKAVAMLLEVLEEQGVPKDVVSEVVLNVEAAKRGIFTPNPEELVSREEMVAAAAALDSSLVARMGGPAVAANAVFNFYSKLFNDEQLKYFFVGLSDDKLRNKQLRLLTYLFGGPAAYATASGGQTLRCTHARLVRDNGLDLPKFERAVSMVVAALREEEVPEDVIADIAKNVEAAKAGIFTPGPDQCVTREEMVEAARELDSTAVAMLGGPEAVYEVISRFYAKLFNDEKLKYFFVLSADRLRTKQFRFMRYLLGGPTAYDGDLTCVHAPLVRDKGLDEPTFARAVDMLMGTLQELAAPQEAIDLIVRNVEKAKELIFSAKVVAEGSGGGGSSGSSRPTTSAAGATAGKCPFPHEAMAALAAGSGGGGGGSRPATAASSTSSASTSALAAAAASADGCSGGLLLSRLGGMPGVEQLADLLTYKIQADPSLSYVYDGTDMARQRQLQVGFLAAALGGDSGAAPAVTAQLAYAHLARDKGLTPAHFDALGAHLDACLAKMSLGDEAVAAEVRRVLAGPSRAALYPPGPAAGCPFADLIAPEFAVSPSPSSSRPTTAAQPAGAAVSTSAVSSAAGGVVAAVTVHGAAPSPSPRGTATPLMMKTQPSGGLTAGDFGRKPSVLRPSVDSANGRGGGGAPAGGKALRGSLMGPMDQAAATSSAASSRAATPRQQLPSRGVSPEITADE